MALAPNSQLSLDLAISDDEDGYYAVPVIFLFTEEVENLEEEAPSGDDDFEDEDGPIEWGQGQAQTQEMEGSYEHDLYLTLNFGLSSEVCFPEALMTHPLSPDF